MLFGVFERFSGIESLVAESLFDTEQLVVLANTVGAACRAGLDKAGVHSHCEVGNGGVLGLARTVAGYGSVAVAVGKVDGVDGLREGANLVHLDKDGVGHLAFDTHLQTFHVGNKQVVAHQLAAVADGVGKEFPAVPVVFGHTVLDADDGVAGNPVFPEIDHLCGSEFLLGGPFQAVHILIFQIIFRRSGVEADVHIFARTVAGLFDGLQYHLDSLLVGAEVGSESY